MPTFGKFTVSISGPYPCWVAIEYDGRQLPRFHHKDLADLKYALARAQQDIASMLGSDRAEVADPN